MYEYKVIPAPVTPLKRKGLKKIEDRFAATLTEAMNTAAAEGWEYVRADTLPCEERSGLTSKTTRFQSLLVFRRPVADAETPATADAPRLDPAAQGKAPDVESPKPAPPLTAPTEDPKRGAVVLDTMRAIRGPRSTEEQANTDAEPPRT